MGWLVLVGVQDVLGDEVVGVVAEQCGEAVSVEFATDSGRGVGEQQSGVGGGEFVVDAAQRGGGGEVDVADGDAVQAEPTWGCG